MSHGHVDPNPGTDDKASRTNTQRRLTLYRPNTSPRPDELRSVGTTDEKGGTGHGLIGTAQEQQSSDEVDSEVDSHPDAGGRQPEHEPIGAAQDQQSSDEVDSEVDSHQDAGGRQPECEPSWLGIQAVTNCQKPAGQVVEGHRDLMIIP